MERCSGAENMLLEHALTKVSTEMPTSSSSVLLQHFACAAKGPRVAERWHQACSPKEVHEATRDTAGLNL